MSMVKNPLIVASEGKPNILWKVVANWKETNRFCTFEELPHVVVILMRSAKRLKFA